MVYTTQLIRAGVNPFPKKPIVVSANTNTTLIPADFLLGENVAYIFIWNRSNSADSVFINVGGTADNGDNNCFELAKGSMASIPCRGLVSAYSVGGCTVSFMIGVAQL